MPPAHSAEQHRTAAQHRRAVKKQVDQKGAQQVSRDNPPMVRATVASMSKKGCGKFEV